MHNITSKLKRIDHTLSTLTRHMRMHTLPTGRNFDEWEAGDGGGKEMPIENATIVQDFA